MYLKNLSVLNFKNFGQISIEFSPKINCFIGLNGVGKTNLLDAIYYLSFTKSFLNAVDSQNINYDQNFFILDGFFEKNGFEDKIYCGVKRNTKKKIKKNGKDYDRLIDHIGQFPAILVSPLDAALILEGSEERRRFLNEVISLFDPLYLEALVKYNRALEQRNALLKQLSQYADPDYSVLEIWNMQLVKFGTEIFEKRKQFIEIFEPLFRALYAKISGGSENANLLYISQLHDKPFDTLLADSVRKDLILEYTTCGIHKDELNFGLDQHPLKRSGSQGQQKSFLLALKFAEFRFISDLKKFHPLLLLDDIFDKLDLKRMNHIIEIISNEDFGQIFITDTDKSHLTSILEKSKAGYKIFIVENADCVEESQAEGFFLLSNQ